MFLFFFVNILFLVILFFIHRGVFLLGFGINTMIYLLFLLFQSTIITWLGSSFAFWLALTGISFVVIFILFFVALFLNQKHLDSHYNQ